MTVILPYRLLIHRLDVYKRQNQDRGLHGRLLRCIRVNYRAGFLFERVGYLVSLSIVMRI